VSDIDTAVVDSLKVLDLERPIREADKSGFWCAKLHATTVPLRDFAEAKYSWGIDGGIF
jgi:hypothetical protein